MELDKAFRFALVLAWEDLPQATEPHSIRIEYQFEPDTLLEHLTVWLDKTRGYGDRVCDYWMRTSSTHGRGLDFRNGYHSVNLAQTLDFIMKNRDQFTHPADASRNGLVWIYPPDAEDHAEAAAWIAGVHGRNTYVSGSAEEEVTAPADIR